MALIFVPNSKLVRLRELVSVLFPAVDAGMAQELLRQIDKELQSPRVAREAGQEEKRD